LNKVVIDTNILFSFFWKKSITRDIILENIFELYTPEFAITEILKYKSEIIQKAKITITEFNNKLEELKTHLIIINRLKYLPKLKKIESLITDKNDADFIALAFVYNLPLWSNDKELEKQTIVTVLNTKEIYLIVYKK